MSHYYRQKVKKWLKDGRTGKTYANRKRKVKVLSFLAAAVLILMLLGLTSVFGVIAYFSKNLPSPDRLSTRQVPQSTKLYSRDGVLLYEIFGDERRTLVKLEDIPEYLRNATIAVEDKDFYSHSGFDFLGIIRGLRNTFQGKGLQGGSTLTQQVVKNTLLSPERTVTRKIKEFILSIQLERKYSKNDILQMYFNESPYGGQAWGVGAAAEMYFGKHVRDLTLAEATLIAGLPQAPSVYSPCGAYPESAKERQQMVVSLMVKQGYITEEQEKEVLSTEVPVVCQGYGPDDIKAPHFVMYVRKILTEMFGEKLVEQGGLRVTTTLDWKTQQIAQEEAEKQIANLVKSKANASNAGVVTVDPKTGQITAMVGSVDYFDTEHDGNVNVILSQRQPGSSIKPLTYLTAFKLGYSPATYVSDIKTCFPGGAGQPDYCPVNWDEKYWGPMSIRTALSNSRNIPAVKMLQVVGVQNMIDLAHELGITSLNEADRYGLSLTLGGGEVRPLDMAQAYAVLAAMGDKHDITPLMKVEDSTGKVLHEYKDASRKVIKPEYVYLVNNVLSDSNARQQTFGKSLDIGRTLAVKTGTTNDNRDAWTIGYTPQMVTVVWVGNFNNDPMNGIMGSTGATPIMKGVITRSLAGQEAQNWEQPKEVVTKTVDKVSGLIPQEGKNFPTVNEVFAKGSEPTTIDDFHVMVRVCKSDPTKLATSYHDQNDLSEGKTFTTLKELSKDWQKYTDEWMIAHREDGYGIPPTEKCGIVVDGKPVEGPVVQITQPSSGQNITGNSFKVVAQVYSQERITRVRFFWDDNLVQTVNSEPYEVDFDVSEMSGNDNGKHTIKVEATDAKGEQSSSSVEINLNRATGGVGDVNEPTPKSKNTPTPTPLRFRLPPELDN